MGHQFPSIPDAEICQKVSREDAPGLGGALPGTFDESDALSGWARRGLDCALELLVGGAGLRWAGVGMAGVGRACGRAVDARR